MKRKKTYINFTKMQGAGNDFVVIDNRHERLSKQQIISIAPQLCDRHFGIGADGVIALEPAESNSDYTMFYRNADGTDAGMCGNGARCLALFASENGYSKNLTFNVPSYAKNSEDRHETIYEAQVKSKNQVEIRFSIQPKISEVSVEDDRVLKVHTGTEHVVLQLTDAELRNKDLLLEKGRKLRREPRFYPPGTNVNFIHSISKNTLFLRTYEKGVENVTLACGTGAIASALALFHLQDLQAQERQSTIVQTDGGTLQVSFTYNKKDQTYHDISLSGEACFVFEGSYEI